MSCIALKFIQYYVYRSFYSRYRCVLCCRASAIFISSVSKRRLSTEEIFTLYKVITVTWGCSEIRVHWEAGSLFFKQNQGDNASKNVNESCWGGRWDWLQRSLQELMSNGRYGSHGSKIWRVPGKLLHRQKLLWIYMANIAASAPGGSTSATRQFPVTKTSVWRAHCYIPVNQLAWHSRSCNFSIFWEPQYEPELWQMSYY